MDLLPAPDRFGVEKRLSACLADLEETSEPMLSSVPVREMGRGVSPDVCEVTAGSLLKLPLRVALMLSLEAATGGRLSVLARNADEPARDLLGGLPMSGTIK